VERLGQVLHAQAQIRGPGWAGRHRRSGRGRGDRLGHRTDDY
jgi:hypothetical protein